MAKPEVIPQDVRRRAHVAVCEFETWVQTTPLLPEGADAHDRLVDVVARAILAEREACVAIAEAHLDDDGSSVDCAGCGETIAQRIRNRVAP